MGYLIFSFKNASNDDEINEISLHLFIGNFQH